MNSFSNKCIARLIHSHRNTSHSHFANSTSCGYKNGINGIQTAITTSKTVLCNCFFCIKGIGRSNVFGSKKWDLATPISIFTGFRRTAPKNLNYIRKANFCFCLFIEVLEYGGCLPLQILVNLVVQFDFVIKTR